MGARVERRRSRDVQKEETRERLLAAAVEAIGDQGLSAARIEDIARAAGVSRATFYFHFPQREDVPLELLRRSQEDLADELAALPDDAPLAEALSCVADHLVARWSAHPNLLVEVGRAALGAVRRPGGEGPEQGPAVAALTDRFRLALARGELHSGLPPELLAVFCLINLFAAAMTWTQLQELELARVLDGAIEFFLRGASTEGPREPRPPEARGAPAQ